MNAVTSPSSREQDSKFSKVEEASQDSRKNLIETMSVLMNARKICSLPTYLRYSSYQCTKHRKPIHERQLPMPPSNNLPGFSSNPAQPTSLTLPTPLPVPLPPLPPPNLRLLINQPKQALPPPRQPFQFPSQPLHLHKCQFPIWRQSLEASHPTL